MRKINREIITPIIGATAGVTLSPIIENLMPGSVPWIDTIIPAPFSNNEIFYPLIIGGISLGAGILTNQEYSNFLLGLGATATVSAILKAVLSPPAARARGMRLPVVRRPVARPARVVAPRAPVAKAPASLGTQFARPIQSEVTGVRSPPVRILY